MAVDTKRNVVDPTDVPVISAEGQQSAAIVDTRRLAELNTLMKVSVELSKSGMFPQLSNGGQVLAVILAGHERGYGAMTSLMNIHIIKGRLGYSAQMIASELRKARVTCDVIETDTEHCKIRFSRKGQEPFVYQWTVKDAQRANKLPAKPDSVWTTYPQDMLFARCLTAGGRKFAPDALMGLRLTDELSELGRREDDEDGSKPNESATEALARKVEEKVDGGEQGKPEATTDSGPEGGPPDNPEPATANPDNTIKDLIGLGVENLVKIATNEMAKVFADDLDAGDAFIRDCLNKKVIKDVNLDNNNAGQLAQFIVLMRKQKPADKAGEQVQAGF